MKIKKDDCYLHDDFGCLEDITCPKCGDNLNIELCDNQELCTYWGNTDPIQRECASCGHRFLIDENVDRTWEILNPIKTL